MCGHPLALRAMQWFDKYTTHIIPFSLDIEFIIIICFLPDKCHLDLPALGLESLKSSQEGEEEWENQVERCYDNWSHQTFKLDTTG